jgi:anhydro-N-acetylmuramic acid kinase
LLGTACDVDGASAARGKVDPVLVEELAARPFFARKPPKSTGRDTFGAAWVGEVLARARARGLLARGPDDALATATAFVAHCVAIALERFVRPAPQRLLVAGGGAHNPTLMRALARACALPVDSSLAAGVDPDAREALVFAVLAARCALEVASTQPGATGASPGRILGKLSFGGCRPKSPG